MVAQSGSLVLLKVYNGSNKTYQTVGGMRATKFTLNNQLIDISHKESGKWRKLLSGSGLSHVSIAGSGIFTDNVSEEIVRVAAFHNQILSFKILFGNLDVLSGNFIISLYERVGNIHEEETYSIGLESAGDVAYTKVSK